MGRHSVSYVAAQQGLSTGMTATDAAKYVAAVGGMALALGLGAVVSSGAGLANAEGASDGAGPAAGDGASAGKGDDGASGIKARKPGLFKAADGGPREPGAVVKDVVSGLISGVQSKSPTSASTAPRGKSQRGAQPSTGLNQVASVVGATRDAQPPSVQRLGALQPPAADPTAQTSLLASSTSVDEPSTFFAARAAAQPVTRITTGISNALGGLTSGTGGSPASPGPILTAALQLIRRETDQPNFQAASGVFSNALILHPGPTPTLPPVPSTPSTASTAPSPTDVTTTDYGDIGKWMLKTNGQVSDYGGQKYDGKTLVEPVNVIIVDPTSSSAAESTLKINKVMAFGGFPAQPVHSSGFRGLIGDKKYRQKPGGLINAYSDNLFILDNDHGRLFGPAPMEGGGYVYSGAFSSEKFAIVNGLPAHTYVSSNAARDALALRLLASGQVQSVSYVPMDNAYNTGTTTTGDHDGYAVVIVLK